MINSIHNNFKHNKFKSHKLVAALLAAMLTITSLPANVSAAAGQSREASRPTVEDGQGLAAGQSSEASQQVPATTQSSEAVDAAVENFYENMPYRVDMSQIKDGKLVFRWTYRNNFTTDSEHGNYDNPYIDIKGFRLKFLQARTLLRRRQNATRWRNM